MAMNPWQLEKMIYSVMVIVIINITQMVEAGCWMKAFEDDKYADEKCDNQMSGIWVEANKWMKAFKGNPYTNERSNHWHQMWVEANNWRKAAKDNMWTDEKRDG